MKWPCIITNDWISKKHLCKISHLMSCYLRPSELYYWFVKHLSFSLKTLNYHFKLRKYRFQKCVFVKCDWAKTRHVHIHVQTEIHFIIPAYIIATLNNYTMHVHCLHRLMLTGLLFQSAFCQPRKSTTGEMVPKESSNTAVVIWYGSHCQCTSI